MLQPILHILNSQKIVLASGSPRRKEILENIGLKFKTVSSKFEENLNKQIFPSAADYALKTAELKVKDVANILSKDNDFPDLLIGADTVVYMNDEIYEKPRDERHAFDILSRFSGHTHKVYTGVVLLTLQKADAEELEDSGPYSTTKFTECTEVTMATLSPAIIRAYIDTGEPMDKAGGYGIQGAGGSLIEGIRGDYFNVMGFPLHSFCRRVSEIYAPKYDQLINDTLSQ